jgi:hypothetical protein
MENKATNSIVRKNARDALNSAIIFMMLTHSTDEILEMLHLEIEDIMAMEPHL